MKLLFNALSYVTRFIAWIVFACGVIFCGLGIYDLLHSLTVVGQPGAVALIAIGLLQSIDMFVIAIVFFVFAIGLRLLFSANPDPSLMDRLPEWLKMKNFMQLKVILWETILTTLVVSFLARLVRRIVQGEEMTPLVLLLPGCILIISISLFFLKKGEH